MSAYNSYKTGRKRKKSMRFRRHEIYYYNTKAGFETEKFAGRLLMMILEGMQEKRKTEILFLCIGTDRSTGDSWDL